MAWTVVKNCGRLEIWTDGMEWPGAKEKVYGPTTYEDCADYIRRSNVRMVH